MDEVRRLAFIPLGESARGASTDEVEEVSNFRCQTPGKSGQSRGWWEWTVEAR
eukprot:CAMPEP_0184397134 /NCGR_PEP_ID=MMETSP0007-20130409/58241_1 /TAXON_ID=97485 /ORGANISM="Prymnesium parvum, Strain Texoma1" /LENGTH=52 /DNA_ID=CAMNT_0026750413 /DNA_START=7 /DNA_END=161 /DNA_ORIENTATION=+